MGSQPIEISSEKFAGKSEAAAMKIALLVFCASATAAAAQVVAANAVVDASALQPVAEDRSGYGGGHGGYGGGGGKGSGTACVVKGSYCNCHYCKCESGNIHCGATGTE